jgi:hypothetical protein
MTDGSVRRFFLVISLSILVLCSLSGCGSEEKVYVDNKETISIRVNQEFTIALHFDLQHLWRESFDEDMLSLVETTFDADPRAERSEEEYSLAEYFRFKALKKGKTEITLNKMTADGQKVIEAKVFSVDIQ